MPPLGVIEGHVLKLGHHVNTDVLHPPRYFSLDPRTVREGFLRHVAEAAGEKLAGDLVIVAGENFGCGSSRETSVQSFRLAGVRAVVAESVARIFYRTCMNLAVPALAAPGVHALFETGDPLRADLAGGAIENPATGKKILFEPIDPYFREVLKAGGLLAWMEKR